MSEYWVSKKKYFCKYCDIYIADDAPSRQQHENGLRHKGNLDRFIRGLYKAGEKRRKDQDEEKRELARVEQAAQAAYSQDVAAGRARPGAGPIPSTSTAATPKKPIPKPSNPYANYSTAASLGYTDPDAERIATEADRRRTQGVVGEWEVVATVTPTLAPSDDEDEKPEIQPDEPASAGTKREAETPADLEDTRAFKLRKKQWSGLDGGYDPDSIPIKLKKREDAYETPVAAESTSTSTSGSAAAPEITPTPSSGLPKWTKVQWKKADENPPKAAITTHDLPDVAVPVEQSPVATLPLKSEINSSTLTASGLQVEEEKPVLVKSEELASAPEASSTSAMFRKRKVPTGGRGRRS
ncbi:hypothetical protein H0H92_012438 [Tricholoma furcatifolium]|nr:hypothetical protein H0H92_012438 [Tricholoma furcatifolium]